MAILKNFKQDSQAIENGEWVPVGGDFDDLEILTKGMTDQYFDLQAAKLNKAARSVGGDVNRLPGKVRRQITVDCIRASLFMDVRNLWHDEEKLSPVTKDEFSALLADPDYMELVVAVMRAAGKVGQQRAEMVEEAVGNLKGSSGAG